MALDEGIHASSAIGKWIALRRPDLDAPMFVNSHARASVDLQREDRIKKVAPGVYSRTSLGAPDEFFVAPPNRERMPGWARRLIGRARWVNGQSGAGFAKDDLIALWHACNGRCAVTGLEFSLRPIGNGKARRAFAPSLDRIEPGAPYSRKNCRLVMVGVNFAMNAWGLDTYLLLARAAVDHAVSETPAS